MTPDRQAELLARWLQEEPGTAPPVDLEEDAVETVYALRPDLAPTPRLTIEDVLAEVTEGPFADIDGSSVQALLTWLEAHPGATPSADIDPDVVETVYALRPDLAPAPQIDLDDIFGAVRAGPFAAASATSAEPQAPPENVLAFAPRSADTDADADAGADAVPAAAAADAAPVDLAQARAGLERHRAAPPARRRLPAWALPGLGALAVAATALLLVVPRAQEALDAPSPFAASEPAPSETLSTVDDAQDVAGRDQSAPALADTGQPEAPPKASPSGASATASRASGAAVSTDAPRQRVAERGASRGGLLSEDVDDVLIPASPAAGAGDTAAGPASGDGALAKQEPDPAFAAGRRGNAEGRETVVSGLESAPTTSQTRSYRSQGYADEDKADDERATTTPIVELGDRLSDSSSSGSFPSGSFPSGSFPSDSFPSGSSSSDSTIADAEGDRAAGSEIQVVEESRRKSSTRSDQAFGGSPGKKTRENPAPSAQAAAEPLAEATPAGDWFDEREESDQLQSNRLQSELSPTAGMSLDQLRTAAWPMGGYPDMTLGRPEVAVAHAAAAEADAAGDDAGFTQALLPLLDHAEAGVALDAAYRIARRQSALGRHDEALATLDRALSRGGAGIQRARLYAMQGQIHERRGDTERAADAYRQAITAR